jgi:hypothetical protein
MINSISSVIGYLGSFIAGSDTSEVEASAKGVLEWLEEGYEAVFGDESDASLTACTPQSSNSDDQGGVHFYLTGDARNGWTAAADQVLRWYCGLTEVDYDQSVSTGQALREANERHLMDDVGGVLYYDSSTPMGVDHRLGVFWLSDTEIFIPTPTPVAICPVVEQPEPAPDAGMPETTDAGPPDVAPDEASQPDADTAETVEEGSGEEGGSDEGSTEAPRPTGGGHRPPRPPQTSSQPDTGPTKPPPTETPPNIVIPQ